MTDIIKQLCSRTIMIMLIPAVLVTTGCSSTKSVEGNSASDEFGFVASPDRKDALFDLNEKIMYDVDLKSNIDEKQKGTLGYTILTTKNKVITESKVNIELDKNALKTVTLKMPPQATGFYKLNITINVTDYDDTIRRVFGVNPESIKSVTTKPADFDNFWQNARDSLGQIPMNAKVTLQPGMQKNGINCYLVELQSWGHNTVRGWLTISKNVKPGRKLPVWLVLPGYGGHGVKPIYGNADLAVFAFNVRGEGNSTDRVNPTRDGYLTTDIENRYKYIYRGAIMDCIRAVDFIYSRPDLDNKYIISSGGSMGGYLSIALCALDSRIKICSANNPVYCDYRSLVGNASWPMKSIEDYSRQRHFSLGKILDNLDYFDLKNFSPNVQCNTLVGISLLDPLAPPANEYAMLNNMKCKYKLFVYPNLGHEVPPPLFEYLSKWMMDEFGIF